jgi:hypothetical protein
MRRSPTCVSITACPDDDAAAAAWSSTWTDGLVPLEDLVVDGRAGWTAQQVWAAPTKPSHEAAAPTKPSHERGCLPWCLRWLRKRRRSASEERPLPASATCPAADLTPYRSLDSPGVATLSGSRKQLVAG